MTKKIVFLISLFISVVYAEESTTSLTQLPNVTTFLEHFKIKIPEKTNYDILPQRIIGSIGDFSVEPYSYKITKYNNNTSASINIYIKKEHIASASLRVAKNHQDATLALIALTCSSSMPMEMFLPLINKDESGIGELCFILGNEDDKKTGNASERTFYFFMRDGIVIDLLNLKNNSPLNLIAKTIDKEILSNIEKLKNNESPDEGDKRKY